MDVIPDFFGSASENTIVVGDFPKRLGGPNLVILPVASGIV
jgi:hypothetical protein